MTDATTSEMRRTQVSVFAYFVHTESDGEEKRDGDKATSKQAGKTSKVETCSSCALANRRQTPKVLMLVLVLGDDDDDDDEEDADHLDWESWTTWKSIMQSSRVPPRPRPPPSHATQSAVFGHQLRVMIHGVPVLRGEKVWLVLNMGLKKSKREPLSLRSWAEVDKTGLDDVRVTDSRDVGCEGRGGLAPDAPSGSVSADKYRGAKDPKVAYKRTGRQGTLDLCLVPRPKMILSDVLWDEFPPIACRTFPTFQVAKYLDYLEHQQEQKASSCASSCAWQVIIHPITLHQAA
ncbi:uncharacterized protein BDZ83DRAFT_646756 [Colletotrichum acutatum]|uniref:Uncharacterized protein n=1 Tax=Glomerella acutata TaxID=27357 RepID=A0AAD9D1Y5_GLOAC|nr:uncharacterized protein BDZ83DRAFT_646756 [Colletotrichum acutatum]KAK1730867.1 hypothetical protein BDZ83DRAFT_646756 [Colletotrichum acutatum]